MISKNQIGYSNEITNPLIVFQDSVNLETNSSLNIQDLAD